MRRRSLRDQIRAHGGDRRRVNVTYVMTARLPALDIDAFCRYEEAVLPLLASHGGRLTRRLRSSDGLTEVHLVEFPSTASFERYRDDGRRQRYRTLLEESGASIELLELYDVEP